MKKAVFERVVKNLSGKVVETETFYGRIIEIEAPDGRQWKTSNSQILVGHYYKDFDKIADVRTDLIHRMSYGLETIRL